MTNIILCSTMVILAFLRTFGLKTMAFQAICHLFVGGLFGYAIAEWAIKKLKFREALATTPMILAITLTMIETIAFILSSIRS